MVDQQLNSPLPDARELVPTIPEPLIEIIGRACQKNPDDRYATGGEMAEALNSFLIEALSREAD